MHLPVTAELQEREAARAERPITTPVEMAQQAAPVVQHPTGVVAAVAVPGQLAQML